VQRQPSIISTIVPNQTTLEVFLKRKLILLFASIFTFCALIFFFVRDEVQDFIIEQQLETRSDAENAGLTCIQKLEKKGVEFVELQKFGQA
jgi:hypothetical protein